MSAQTIDRTCQASIPTSSFEIQCDLHDPLNSKFLSSVSQMVNDPSNPFSTASQSTSDLFNQQTKVQTSQDNDIAALESKISELETENVSLNLEVEELRSSLAKVQATLNSREWQLKELSHRIRGVENGVESIENWEQVIDSIRNEIVQSKSLSDKLKAELEKLQSENDILQKEKVHAESRQEDLESEVRKLEADLIAAKVNENNLQNTLTMINEGTVQGARDIRKDRKLRRRGLSSIQEADDDPLALQSHRYTSKRGATASRGWYRHWFMICIFVLAAIVGTQIWGALTASRTARIKKRALSTLAESSFELFEEVLVDSSSIAGLGRSPIDGSWIGLEDESSYWWNMQGSDLEGISGEDIPT
ncbi:hypothetical protein BKA69DRAFT_801725 [Paraphysoderma sedebokerense]|nr:hypothetical protein BKA69DRAFT_801725 [Paraphysoderma sedebokerense]